MTKYMVKYGERLNDLSSWTTEANSPEHAKRLFREKFGFNFIKIQSVKEYK